MHDDAIPAATLVTMRPDPAGGPPELLIVRRTARMAFAAGMIVFPGGRIDEADRLLAERLGAHDKAAHVTAIREVFAGPLMVDADTGFGNALNMRRTIQVLERAGADAIQIEDQVFPKRCGHFEGKEVIPAAEMVGKIKIEISRSYPLREAAQAHRDVEARKSTGSVVLIP